MQVFAFAEDTYAARIVKKLLVKYGSKHKLLTNLPEFAPYHKYSEAALEEIAQIVQKSIHPDRNLAEIKADLSNLVVEACASGIRGNWELTFDNFVSIGKLFRT